MTRKRISGDKRREEILNVAADLFIEHGFEGVSMGSLASEIGTSRPNIYTYFPRLEAILDALLAEHLARAEADLIACLQPGQRPDFGVIFDVLSRHRRLLPDRLHAIAHPVDQATGAADAVPGAPAPELPPWPRRDGCADARPAARRRVPPLPPGAREGSPPARPPPLQVSPSPLLPSLRLGAILLDGHANGAHGFLDAGLEQGMPRRPLGLDRKNTRLNSSH